MRDVLTMAGLLVTGLGLSACDSQPAAPPAQEEAAPTLLKAGEWSINRKTTGYNTPTVTPEEYQAALKQESKDKLCLAVDAQGVPDANALAGAEGSDCSYKDKLVRKGRLIATLACKAGSGTSEIVVEGNFTADSMTLGTTMTKVQDGKPVLRTTHDLSGTRTGDCPA